MSILAPPTEITLGGQKLLMSPLTEGDSAELDEWVRSQFIAMARRSLPGDATDDDWDRTVSLAMREAVSLSWMRRPGLLFVWGSKHGLARLIWQGCIKNQKGLTHEDVIGLFKTPEDIKVAQSEYMRINDLKMTKREEANGTANP